MTFSNTSTCTELGCDETIIGDILVFLEDYGKSKKGDKMVVINTTPDYVFAEGFEKNMESFCVYAGSSVENWFRGYQYKHSGEVSDVQRLIKEGIIGKWSGGICISTKRKHIKIKSI